QNLAEHGGPNAVSQSPGGPIGAEVVDVLDRKGRAPRNEGGIDGLRSGTARPFPLWRLRTVRRPSIQNIRERYFDHVAPDPNTWTLNIQAAWSVPTRGAFC